MVADFGPLPPWWAFQTEQLNGKLGSIRTNGKLGQIEGTLMRDFIEMAQLAHFGELYGKDLTEAERG